MIRGVHQARDPGAIAQWFARSQKVSLIIITEFNDSHEHSPCLNQNSATTTLASNNDFGGASVTRLSFPSTPLLSTRYLSSPIQIGLTMTTRATRTPIPPIFQEDASKPASGFPCHPRRNHLYVNPIKPFIRECTGSCRGARVPRCRRRPIRDSQYPEEPHFVPHADPPFLGILSP